MHAIQYVLDLDLDLDLTHARTHKYLPRGVFTMGDRRMDHQLT